MNYPRVEIYRDAAGGWRWRLRARNGRIVMPNESHTRHGDVKRAFARVLDLMIVAEANPVVVVGEGDE